MNKREMLLEPSDLTEPYWTAAEDRELVIPYCETTEQYFFPPRELSPYTFTEDWHYREVSGRGTVFTYTVMHFSPVDSYEDDTPYVVALVELEEGPRMMSNIVDADPGSVEVGLPVKVCFEERGDRRIPQFRLLEDDTG